MQQPEDDPVDDVIALSTERDYDELRRDVSDVRRDLERIAAHLVPLLGEQHRTTEQRVRSLEQQLHQRQERPVAVRLAQLLVDVQRLTDPRDARVHVLEGLEDVLFQLGYEQFGEVGDLFDDRLHEAVDGTGGGGVTVVERVYARGLWSFGDVIVRARVGTSSTGIDNWEEA